MTAGRRRLLSLLGLCSILGLPVSAHAEEPHRADTLFEEARALILERRYDEACAKLAESEKLDPAIGTEFQLARCYELSGRTASAWKLYVQLVRATHAAGQDAREAAVQQRIAELSPRLSHLRVRSSTAVKGLAVTLDGAALPAHELGTALTLDPGAHRIRARAPGYKDWEQTVQLEEAATIEVVVPKLTETSPRKSRTASPPALSTDTVVVDQRAASGRRTLALIVGGVGVATLATGLGFGVRSWMLHNEAEDTCNGSVCTDPEDHQASKDARTAGDISTILVASGAAVLAGGVVLWFTAPKPSAKTQASLRFNPAVSTNHIGLSLRSSF